MRWAWGRSAYFEGVGRQRGDGDLREATAARIEKRFVNFVVKWMGFAAGLVCDRNVVN